MASFFFSLPWLFFLLLALSPNCALAKHTHGFLLVQTWKPSRHIGLPLPALHSPDEVLFCSFPFSFFFFVFLPFLGPLPRHMEGPRLGVKSEVQRRDYMTVTSAQDPSRICNRHHSSQQCRILNPLIEAEEARDQTHILIDTSRIHFCCVTMGTPLTDFKI